MLPNFYTPVRRTLTNYEIVTLCTMTNIPIFKQDFLTSMLKVQYETSAQQITLPLLYPWHMQGIWFSADLNSDESLGWSVKKIPHT